MKTSPVDKLSPKVRDDYAQLATWAGSEWAPKGTVSKWSILKPKMCMGNHDETGIFKQALIWFFVTRMPSKAFEERMIQMED
jgi:hypothetical protein